MLYGLQGKLEAAYHTVYLGRAVAAIKLAVYMIEKYIHVASCTCLEAILLTRRPGGSAAPRQQIVSVSTASSS